MSIQRCESTTKVIQTIKESKIPRKELITQYKNEANGKDENKAINAMFALGVCYEEGLHETGLWTKSDLKNAHAWYTAAAQLGHASAQCNLGVMYYYGRGVIQDSRKAYDYFIPAAKQKNVTAQYNLGEFHYNLALKNNFLEDQTPALTYYRLAAEQKHSKAQERLVECHQKGIGVTPFFHSASDEAAFKYYNKESKNDSYAAFLLGVCYLYGIGTEQNLEEGLRLIEANADYLKFLKSNGSDIPDSQTNHFTSILPDFLKKIRATNRSATIKEFNKYAQEQCSLRTSSTAPQSFTYHQNALRSFSLAAALGSVEALYGLGECYEYSAGQKSPIALKYYRLSAKQGYLEAQKKLIQLPNNNRFFETDVAAVDFYKKEQQLDSYAEFKLGFYYFLGTPNIAKGLELISKNRAYLHLATEFVERCIPKDSAVEMQFKAMLESSSPSPIANIEEDLITPTNPDRVNELSADSRKDLHQNAYNIVTNIIRNPTSNFCNSYDPRGEYTILIHVICCGFTALIRDLLGQQPDLGLRDRLYARTALHWAVITKNYLIIQDLLNFIKTEEREIQSSLIDAQDVHGITPLMLAAKTEDLDIVKLLCKAGADPNIADKKGKKASVYANSNAQIVGFLTGLSASTVGKDGKESKAQPAKDSKDQSAIEAEEIKRRALEYIAAIKDADHPRNEETLKAFFTDALALEELKPEESKRLEELRKLKELKKAERAELEKLEKKSQYLQECEKLKKILTYNNTGKFMLDYATKQDNTYVKRQLVALAEKLGISQIALPSQTPEQRSQALSTLLVRSLREVKKDSRTHMELFGNARRKIIEKAKALIDEGINAADQETLHVIFILLINHGFTSLIHHILQTYPDRALRLITERECDSLGYAIENGNPEIVLMLLKQLSNARLVETYINDADKSGHTPLMQAVANGNIRLAKLLIANGADYRNLKNSKGESAYDMAVRLKLQELIDFISTFEAAAENPKEQLALTWGMLGDTINGKPPEKHLTDEKQLRLFYQQCRERRSQELINAIRDGDSQKIHELFPQGFDVNYRDHYGFNVLNYAAMAGELELVSKLIKNPEVDIHAKASKYGQPTALELAFHFDHPNIVRTLLNTGATVQESVHPLAKSAPIDELTGDVKKDRTKSKHEIRMAKEKAQLLANNAKKVGHAPTIQQLEKQGLVDPAKDKDPKNVAIEQKHEAPKKTKQSPLLHAAKIGDEETVRALLSNTSSTPAGFQETDVDEYGYTPLHWAVQKGHTGIINALLENKANIEAEDSAGATPLLIAVLHQKADAVRILIRNGANTAVEKLPAYVETSGFAEHLLIKEASSSVTTLSSGSIAPHSVLLGGSSKPEVRRSSSKAETQPVVGSGSMAVNK